MFGVHVIAGHTDAAVVLGIVLAEAVLLYVGYGIVTGAVNSFVARFIERG